MLPSASLKMKLLIEHGKKQPLYQLLGLGIALAAAIGGGVLSGYAVGRVDLAKQSLGEHDLYEDSVYWAEVEHED